VSSWSRQDVTYVQFYHIIKPNPHKLAFVSCKSYIGKWYTWEEVNILIINTTANIVEFIADISALCWCHCQC